MKLSKNLSLREVTKSNTATRHGIDNNPTNEHLENLKIVAREIFQPIREHFNVPVGVSSGYRSELLNVTVKGSATSHHCKGMALDLDADIYGEIDNKDIFLFVLENLEFTQLIWEYGDDQEPAWVHIGYDSNNLKKEVLKIARGTGYKKYYKK